MLPIWLDAEDVNIGGKCRVVVKQGISSLQKETVENVNYLV